MRRPRVVPPSTKKNRFNQIHIKGDRHQNNNTTSTYYIQSRILQKGIRHGNQSGAHVITVCRPRGHNNNAQRGTSYCWTGGVLDLPPTAVRLYRGESIFCLETDVGFYPNPLTTETHGLSIKSYMWLKPDIETRRIRGKMLRTTVHSTVVREVQRFQ